MPFIQKQFSHIYETNDGFADRILLCTPKPKLLLEEEVEEWAKKLDECTLKSLSPVMQLIERWHPDTEDIVYTFTGQGKKVYLDFANETVKLMNQKWENPTEYDSVGNVSKDKRTMVR